MLNEGDGSNRKRDEGREEGKEKRMEAVKKR